MPIVAPENYTWLGGIQICARQQWQNQMKSYVSGMLLTEQDAHWDVLPVKSLLFFAASTSRSILRMWTAAIMLSSSMRTKSSSQEIRTTKSAITAILSTQADCVCGQLGL